MFLTGLLGNLHKIELDDLMHTQYLNWIMVEDWRKQEDPEG